MAEMIDIYDERRRPTGRQVPRVGARLGEGEYMLYVLAIVQDPQGQILLTQRALDKRWAPGCWEVPGGGVLAGETSEMAVVREVREETGLDISCAEKRVAYTYCNEDLEHGDNYFVDIYRVELEVCAADVVLQQSESIDWMLATRQKIAELNDAGAFLHFSRIMGALQA